MKFGKTKNIISNIGKAVTFRRIVTVFLAAAVLLVFSGCGAVKENEKNDDGSLQRILDAGQLVLGLDMAFPPMGYVDENGEIVGFDIDMAREVCRRLGVELVLRGINWDTKEDELNSGLVDCIWNGLSVTPSRSEAMCLSEPYMNNAIIFVVPGTSNIKSISDLNGVKVGVQSGSTAEELLTASDIYSDVTVERFATQQELFEALSLGKLDTALVDSVVAFHYIFSTDDPYFILADSFGEEQYAIAFRKADIGLCDRVQEILGEMKADGTLGEISKKWFGSDITIVK